MRPKSTVSLATIADKLGISINTVSRALRDCYDISPETKKAVCNCAFELGYIYKKNSNEKITLNSKKTVALVYNSLIEPIFGLYSDLLIKGLKDKGFDITVAPCESTKLTLEVVRNLVVQRIDAIISFLDFEDDAYQAAETHNIKMIVMGRKPENENLPAVYFDDKHGGELVAEYFYQSNYKKVAYIGLKDIGVSLLRGEGFLEVCKKHNMQCESVYMSSFDDVVQVAKILNNGGFEGIFVFNDSLVNCINNNLKESIDIDLVGFDSLSSFLFYMPKIKSVEIDYQQLVNDTLEEFIKIMDNSSFNKNDVIKKMLEVKLNF